jgi:two-component system sensor histidine kinase/response regulator
MGGELDVQSEIGRGSVFKFAVPVQVVDESAVARRSEERIPVGLEAGQPAYRLLAVDDREMSRALLKKMLRPLGFEVREAANGQQAVDVWREWHPHLIWMDMRMPVMNGYDATRAIKATTEGQATVVIALTASAFEEDRAMILSEGCDDFMRKPFRQEDVFEKLKQHLGVRFIYDADDSGGAEAESGDDALSLENMPADWIAQFDEAANQADFDRLLALIDEVSDQKLAGALAEKVNGFDYDTLLSLTRKAKVLEE